MGEGSRNSNESPKIISELEEGDVSGMNTGVNSMGGMEEMLENEEL